MEKKLINAIDDGDNVLLTGGAGVGKTFHTNEIINHLKNKNKKFAVCAMTGLASQHLHFGMTIHRFLQVGNKTKKSDIDELLDSDSFMENLETICGVSAIIIDEVSMMRSDFLELMNEVLKNARYQYNLKNKIVLDHKENLPFGGYQIILVGDFCQLPPVVPGEEKVPCKWIFQHKLFLDGKFRVFNLTEVKRTNDPTFALTLNKVRVGYCDDIAFDMISKRNEAVINGEGTVLMSRINGVKYYNEERLNHHDGELLLLQGNVSVREELKDQENLIRKLYRTAISESGLDKEIRLKIGCKIMLLTNNSEMGYSNGSQGVVLGTKTFDILSNQFTDNEQFTHDLDYKYFGECLHVLLDSGREVVVPKKAYNIFGNSFDAKGKRLVDVTFWQYPVTLGYAVSIHKSQGMSLNNMILDCSKIFADGQFYVGLSRARSLEGLSILNFNKHYIKADEDAVNFYLKISELKQGEIYE
jgi:hypothetical protein